MGKMKEKLLNETFVTCRNCNREVPLSTSCIIDIPVGENEFEEQAICYECMDKHYEHYREVEDENSRQN